MKKVFITGGAGFIGSHLVSHLLSKGVKVTVYDRFTGATADKNRLEKFRSNPNLTFIRGDLLQTHSLEFAMDGGHDTVIHLAANGDIPAGIKDTRLDMDNNVIGTYNVVEAMRKVGVYNLLFSSTAAVYGDKPLTIHKENSGPLHPISLYGGSKLACEGIISGFAHLYGIRSLIFRFGNVVGGGMDHGVIHDLIYRLRRDPKQLRVWGDGRGLKPYFMVSDCIHGMLTCYNAMKEGDDRVLVDTYNLGVNTLTAVHEVASIVVDQVSPDADVYFEGGRHGFQGDVPIVRYDVSKAESVGWRASLPSTEAVRLATLILSSEIK